MCVCVLVCVCVYIYIHIYDCVEILYELSLLPHNIACETFLHELGGVRRPYWIFIIGVLAWR